MIAQQFIVCAHSYGEFSRNVASRIAGCTAFRIGSPFANPLAQPDARAARPHPRFAQPRRNLGPCHAKLLSNLTGAETGPDPGRGADMTQGFVYTLKTYNFRAPPSSALGRARRARDADPARAAARGMASR